MLWRGNFFFFNSVEESFKIFLVGVDNESFTASDLKKALKYDDLGY